jgi:hypothetical protein
MMNRSQKRVVDQINERSRAMKQQKDRRPNGMGLSGKAVLKRTLSALQRDRRSAAEAIDPL